MNEITFTGGARIGRGNVTWPLATLKVNDKILELNASIVGNVIFQTKDILSIEIYNGFSFIGKGLKINHRIAEYNSEIIFWTFDNPESILNQIFQTGFLTNNSGKISDDNEKITRRQKTGSFPVKKSVAITFGIVWNVLFLIDLVPWFMSGQKGFFFGYGVMSVMSAVFLFSVLLLISKDFGKLILKEGRVVKDINKFLYFLIFFSAFMLLAILSFRNLAD